MLELEKSCDIKRGKCLTHGIQVRKTVLSIKKWRKIKTGYGWIYGKKTKYICRLETKEREAPEISTLGDKFVPVQPALVGIRRENISFESDSEGLIQRNNEKD